MAGVSWAGILLLLDYLKPSQDMKLTYYTAVFTVLMALMLMAVLSAGRQNGWHRKGVYGAFCLLAVFELAYGAKLQMYNYHTSDVETYQRYVSQQERCIEDIALKEENGIYRVSQTTTRNHNKELNRTANYNGVLAFGYASLNGYTSAPDDVQMGLLDRMGYRKEGGNMTIVNTCLLGVDSLLGVKYILSEYPLNGLVEAACIGAGDGKKVYENPFCLPFAFTYEEKPEEGDGHSSVDDQNPFEYQNMLYSQLAGETIELYQPLAYTRKEGEQGILVYSIQVPAGSWAVYGNIPWKKQMGAMVDVNYAYRMAYSGWLSPSVFYIPTENRGEGETAVVELSAVDRDGLEEGEEQFYALDLEVLEMVSDLARAREAENNAFHPCHFPQTMIS